LRFAGSTTTSASWPASDMASRTRSRRFSYSLRSNGRFPKTLPPSLWLIQFGRQLGDRVGVGDLPAEPRVTQGDPPLLRARRRLTVDRAGEDHGARPQLPAEPALQDLAQ